MTRLKKSKCPMRKSGLAFFYTHQEDENIKIGPHIQPANKNIKTGIFGFGKRYEKV